MKSAKLIRVVILVFFYSFSHNLIGQNAIRELDLDSALSKWYDRLVGDNYNGLYEGSTYVLKDPTSIRVSTTSSVITHPFFGTPRWVLGDIKFGGQVYKEVDMQYDVYNDVLIVLKKPAQAMKISQPNVEYFEMGDARFVYLDEAQAPSLGAGFYEDIFISPQIAVVVKREKIRNADSRVKEYVNDDKYYVRRDGEFHFFLAKKKIVSLFKENKAEIRKFIKANRLKIAPGSDADLRILAQFCDQFLP